MRRPVYALPLGVLALVAVACIAAPALTLAGVHSPLRVAAAFTLFGIAPGAALLPWLSPRGVRAEPALVVAVSLAVSLISTQIMLWAGAWSPPAGACLLGGACLASMAAQVVIRAREAA